MSKTDFPYLNDNNCRVTSNNDPRYNCIAWAYGENSKWFWPMERYYWPANITREETAEAFVKLFATAGYKRCDNQLFESGYEKVAIYILNDKPTHAARQLSSGKWTSKLGSDIDIEHDAPEVLNGPIYGNASIFLKREIN